MSTFRSQRYALATHGSANRWICGLLPLAQICPTGQTSHIPETLDKIAALPVQSYLIFGWRIFEVKQDEASN